jgi:hypothetical protein
MRSGVAEGTYYSRGGCALGDWFVLSFDGGAFVWRAGVGARRLVNRPRCREDSTKVTFTGLNGGPQFKFNEAISLQVFCETQQELDHYWDKLSEGGDASAQQCGWLKDKFGVSWQVVPTVLQELVSDPDSAKSQRAFEAMLQMKKLDIAGLQRAYAG